MLRPPAATIAYRMEDSFPKEGGDEFFDEKR